MNNHDYDYHSGKYYATGVDVFSNQAFSPAVMPWIPAQRIPLLIYQILSDQQFSWRFSAEFAHRWCTILLHGQPSVVVLQWAYTVATRTMSLNPATQVRLALAEHCLEIP